MHSTRVHSVAIPCMVAATIAGCSAASVPTAAPRDDATATSGLRPADGADAGTRERNVVRKKLPRNVKSIALEYTVILIDESGNERAVDPAEHTFEVGDSFLVRIRPQDDLYVYVFNEGPQGERICLLPAEDEKPEPVRAGADITLPDDGYFTFEPPAGEEKLVVVALPEPTNDLRLLTTSVFKGQAAGLESEDKAAAAKQADAAIDALREKSGAAVRTRGPVRKVVERLDGLGEGVAVSHVEPPLDGESSSYGIAIAAGDADGPELVLDIPLRSRGSPSTADGK
jgi:hypothetical protein